MNRFSFLILFLFSHILYAQSTDEKVTSILKTNGTIEVYKSIMLEKGLDQLKLNADYNDNLKIKELENKLTDAEIISRLIKGFKSTFNEKEVDCIYKFYNSEAGKKLFSSSEILENNLNSNFQDVETEIQRISDKQNPMLSEKKIEDDNPVSTSKEDGLYSVVNYDGSTLNLADLKLSDRPEITKSEILEAKKIKDDLGRNAINIKFTKTGTQKLKTFTKNNIGQPLAIIFNKKILSAPVIFQQIPNGEIQISGNFTDEFMREILNAFHTN